MTGVIKLTEAALTNLIEKRSLKDSLGESFCEKKVSFISLFYGSNDQSIWLSDRMSSTPALGSEYSRTSYK